jgi:hypothetical protein
VVTDEAWARTGLPAVRRVRLLVPTPTETDSFCRRKTADWSLALEGIRGVPLLSGKATRNVDQFREWVGYVQVMALGVQRPVPPVSRRDLRAIRKHLHEMAREAG